jgi:FMN phosphatase YigB (HAD superfamily)
MEHDRLEALLIDVGGTLVDDATWVNRARYERLMVQRLRGAFGTDEPWFETLASHPFTDSDAPEWEQRTAEVVVAWLADRDVQVTAEQVERICRAFALPLGDVVELADGAREAVEAIHELGVPMVLCTNTLWRNDADVRRDWEALGFGDLFDGYVSSHDTGFGKPHPAMFERCLDIVGADASRAAIIGDRPERDIAGARRVGMRSLWMRPPDFDGPADPAPDVEIRHWSEVPPVIEAWRNGQVAVSTGRRSADSSGG